MEPHLSFGNIQVNLSASGSKAMGKPKPETPFRILILGDFAGRGHRGIQQPLAAQRRPIAVDIDNLDTIMEKLALRVELPAVGAPDQGSRPGTLPGTLPGVSFSELEDFHPDRIYQRLEFFQVLRKTRQELLNPATFAAAAKEIASWAAGPAGGSTPAPGQATKGGADQGARGGGGGESDRDMMTRLLGRPGNPHIPAAQTRAEMSVEALLRQAVGPHIVQGADPRQDQLVAAVDGATTHQMRQILHAPEFQAVEAAWRGLDFLIRNLETDENLKVYLLDVTREELVQDMMATENLKSTGLYQLLVEQTIHTPGGQPWAVVMGNYTFDATVEDAQVLGRVAKIVREAGAPFLAGGGPRLLGCGSIAATPNPREWTAVMDPQAQEAWRALQDLDEAAYVGLVTPRFLLRLPYGKDTEPIERFDFQELDPNQWGGLDQHEKYLWGNGAWVGVLLLGQMFAQDGWDLSPGGRATVEGIAAHTFKKNGESTMKPCAEAWLTDTAADAIMEKGLMPLLSIKGRDAVRLWRFGSIARPAQNLAGRWQ